MLSPRTVLEFNLASRGVTSCDDLIVVVLGVRTVCSWGKGGVEGFNISSYLQHKLARWG